MKEKELWLTPTTADDINDRGISKLEVQKFHLKLGRSKITQLTTKEVSMLSRSIFSTSIMQAKETQRL